MKIPDFRQDIRKIKIKKMFCFHAYGHYPNIVFTFFYLKNKYLKFKKCVFAWIS
jgi:hypothetical protein